MNKSQPKKNYIFIALAVLAIVAMTVWAFLQGRRDAAEDNLKRTNQAANATR